MAFILHVTQTRGAQEPIDLGRSYDPGQYYIWLEATEGEEINHVRFEIDGIKYREVHPPYEVIPPVWDTYQTHSIFFQVRSEKQWFTFEVGEPPIVVPPEDPDDPPPDDPVEPIPPDEDPPIELDPPPGPPGTPQFTDLGGGDVLVSWNEGDEADSYVVTYPAQPAGVAEPTTSITLSDLNPDEIVCVHSVNTVGTSDDVCALYQVPDVGTPPENPSSRPEFEFLDPDVRVTWGAATGATSYLISRKNAPSQSVIGTTIDLPLVDGDWLCVRAVNDFGQSAEQLCNTYNAEEIPNPTPPGTGYRGNEPEGMIELFANVGDSAGPNLCTATPDPTIYDSWGFRGQHNSLGDIVSADPATFSLPDSPASVNPDKVWIGTWKEGFGATGFGSGGSPFSVYHQRSWTGKKAKSAYWAFYYYLPSVFQWHPQMVKGWWMTNGGYTNHFVPMRSNLGGGFGSNDAFGLYLQFNGADTTRPAANIFYEGVQVSELPRDQWMLVEFLFVANSAGNVADGKYRCWVDSVLVSGHDDVHYFSQHNFNVNEAVFNRVQYGPTWGGGGDNPVLADQSIGFDHLYVSYKQGEATTPPPEPEDPPTDPPPNDPPDDPEDPEAPGDSNEPADMIPRARLTFESGFTAQLGDAWVREWSLPRMQVLADSTAPNGFCMRGKFPKDLEDGQSPWRFDLWGPLRATGAGTYQYSELFVSFWLRVEGTDYENQAVGTKTYYLAYGTALRHNDGLPIWLSGNGTMNALLSNIYIMGRFSTTDEDGQDTPALAVHPNVQIVNLKVGEWTKFETYLKINDIGSNNGIIDIWVNGKHTTHRTDWRFRSAESPRAFYNLEFTPVWGGNTATGKRLRDDYWRVADVYISGKV